MRLWICHAVFKRSHLGFWWGSVRLTKRWSATSSTMSNWANASAAGPAGCGFESDDSLRGPLPFSAAPPRMQSSSADEDEPNPAAHTLQ